MAEEKCNDFRDGNSSVAAFTFFTGRETPRLLASCEDALDYAMRCRQLVMVLMDPEELQCPRLVLLHLAESLNCLERALDEPLTVAHVAQLTAKKPIDIAEEVPRMSEDSLTLVWQCQALLRILSTARTDIFTLEQLGGLLCELLHYLDADLSLPREFSYVCP
ncbi:hypothetical protein CIG19_15800 [Enterobacterales bacterium CwR94]|nr:hypothetical protein CIG19_15800 [Enterobacterales bacterium CwR94]